LEEEKRPVASLEHILETFRAYLQALHRSFSTQVIKDNPELAAEGQSAIAYTSTCK
jgi:hypothetical protein